MTEYFIVYSNPENGLLHVVSPAIGVSFEQVVAHKDFPKDIPYYKIDAEKFPDDRVFREAWECLDGENVTINFEKAISCTKERLRADRKHLLEKLDIDFQRALENGESTAEIVAKKNFLRDLPDKADQCCNIEQLNALSATL